MNYKGIICISAIDWNYLKQRTQYLMAGLADKGYKVLFIENTGIRCPNINDIPRVINRMHNAVAQGDKAGIPENLEVFSPLAIPLPFNTLAVTYNNKYFILRIKKFLKKNGLKPSEIILWTYLTTPVVLSLIGGLDWGLIIYDVVCDPKFIQPDIEPYESKLLKKADFTFFASATLYEKYRDCTKYPILFKDGFNLEISNNRVSIQEIQDLPHPRFIYIGGINKKLRLDLIEELAEHFQAGSVILVGPRTGNINVPSTKNIFLFPQQKYENLAGFLREADASLVPYIPDDYSGAMHPAKLNEYMIFGLPVVATETPELKMLSDIWGDGLFYFGNTGETFIRAAGRAISEDSVELKNKRLALALNNTWEKRIDELEEIISHVLN